MRGDDGHREQVWNKRGSRFQLPRVPRPSLKTLLKALPVIGIASVSLVGFLAVPAGSPPPLPAVAAEPIATDQPTDTPTIDPVVSTPSEQPVQEPPLPPPPHCHPRVHRISTQPTPGTVVYADLPRGSIFLYDPKTDKQTVVLDAKVGCNFRYPAFVNDHTIRYAIFADYPKEAGNFLLDMGAASVRRLKSSGTKWDWIAFSSVSPDGSRIAELGAVAGASTFTLVVSSTDTGRILYGTTLGWICGCDGDFTPQDLRWSSDGAFLLTAVPTQTSHEVLLLDARGRNVRTPLMGAFPRWIPNTHAFIFQDPKGDWSRADGLVAKPHVFYATTSQLIDPALSPDKTKLAFWDLIKLNVVVYDLSTGKAQRFGKLQGNPMWLDDETLAVTGVRTCNCEGLEYTGKSWSLQITSGRTQPIRMTSTLEADVLR
jgi:hypothetical protein